MSSQVQTQSQRVQEAHRPRKAFPWGKIVAWFFLGLLLFVTIFPFYWMIRTALTHPKALFLDTASLLPVQATLINFQRVVGLVDMQTAVALGGSGQSINFLRSMLNSIIAKATLASSLCPLPDTPAPVTRPMYYTAGP